MLLPIPARLIPPPPLAVTLPVAPPQFLGPPIIILIFMFLWMEIRELLLAPAVREPILPPPLGYNAIILMISRGKWAAWLSAVGG